LSSFDTQAVGNELGRRYCSDEGEDTPGSIGTYRSGVAPRPGGTGEVERVTYRALRDEAWGVIRRASSHKGPPPR
jgi:hypothetical protein